MDPATMRPQQQLQHRNQNDNSHVTDCLHSALAARHAAQLYNQPIRVTGNAACSRVMPGMAVVHAASFPTNCKAAGCEWSSESYGVISLLGSYNCRPGQDLSRAWPGPAHDGRFRKPTKIYTSGRFPWKRSDGSMSPVCLFLTRRAARDQVAIKGTAVVSALHAAGRAAGVKCGRDEIRELRISIFSLSRRIMRGSWRRPGGHSPPPGPRQRQANALHRPLLRHTARHTVA